MKPQSNFLKSLIMTVITFLASTLSTSGFPTTTSGKIALLITIAGTVLVYIAKNLVFPSVSLMGTIDLRDVLSGIILAIGSALSSFAASGITGTSIDWHALFTLMGSVVVGYFAKNFAAGPKPLTAR